MRDASRGNSRVNSRMKPKLTGRKRLMRILPRLLFLIVVLGMIAAVPYAALAGYRHVKGFSLFAVTKIEVVGLKYVKTDDFSRYMGATVGSSLLDYDLNAAVVKADGHPWIKSAVIRRELPNTLRFELVERVPALVAVSATGNYLIDTDGMAVARIEGAGWEFLPRFDYEVEAPLKLVDKTTADRFLEALLLYRAVHDEPSERLVGCQVLINKEGQPYMKYIGAVVKVGAGEYATKMTRLAEVTQDIQRRGAKPTCIDLRFPGKVVVSDVLNTAAADKTAVSPVAVVLGKK